MKRRTRRRRGAFSWPEILLAAALVLLLLFVLLPALKRNRESAHPSDDARRPVLVSELRHVEEAKSLYAADRHLKKGDPITMNDLVQSGYLKHTPNVPKVRFIVGVVGEPVRFLFEEAADEHDDKRQSVKHEDHNGSGR